MEINKYTDIIGVVAADNIVEGRMVFLLDHNQSHDFGSRTDLPAAKVPTTAAEAKKARYIITFAVDNSQLPIYNPYPTYDFALRYGFDRTTNLPFSATVYLTYPSVQEGLTIPSGALALAFGPGVYTIPPGAYVYSANIENPGEWLEVEYTGSDAGKLKVDADASEKFAQVEHYDSATGKLTFRINW